MEDSLAAGSIAPSLLAWYDSHARALPWRELPGSGRRADPYRVWLSEVMLQQTTVAAVTPRFVRFLERWPGIAALAAAPEAEVMAEWAGLGYYARARNLLACAREVASRGGFPATEAELRALPGIGAYTAAAIAAIAFGERAVVVDANVERVVARLFAIDTPLPQARPAIRAAADRITPAERAGDFAQAMMDLGATICVPRRPECSACPIARPCRARAAGRQAELPVRPVKRVRPLRRGTAWWIERDDHVLTVTRPGRGMLAGMRALPDDGWSARGDGSGAPPFAAEWRAIGKVAHAFTHFALELTIRKPLGPIPHTLPEGEWIAREALAKAGLPTLFAKAVLQAMASADASEDAAAQHQADDRDDEHDEAEIAPRVGSRQRAEPDADERDRQDEPVAPAKERDGRGDRQEQRDQADEDREKIEHGVLYR